MENAKIKDFYHLNSCCQTKTDIYIRIYSDNKDEPFLLFDGMFSELVHIRGALLDAEIKQWMLTKDRRVLCIIIFSEQYAEALKRRLICFSENPGCFKN